MLLKLKSRSNVFERHKTIFIFKTSWETNKAHALGRVFYILYISLVWQMLHNTLFYDCHDHSSAYGSVLTAAWHLNVQYAAKENYVCSAAEPRISWRRFSSRYKLE